MQTERDRERRDGYSLHVKGNRVMNTSHRAASCLLGSIVIALSANLALATPPIPDWPRKVTTDYENGDRLVVTCNADEQCEFDVRIFSRRFRVSKKSLAPAGKIQPHYVFLTPLDSSDSSYGIDISVSCTEDELKLGGDIDCYAMIKLRGNNVVESTRILTRASDIEP